MKAEGVLKKKKRNSFDLCYKCVRVLAGKGGNLLPKHLYWKNYQHVLYILSFSKIKNEQKQLHEKQKSDKILKCKSCEIEI